MSILRFAPVALLGPALAACGGPTAPPAAVRASVADLAVAPSATTVIREAGGRLVVRGTLRATCGPYRLTPTATVSSTTVALTLTAAVTGTSCPQDVVWTRGYEAAIEGVPAGVRAVRVLHALDVAGAAPELLYEGPLPAP